MNTSSIIYFIKSSFKGMYKNAVMTLASVFILIACMLIIGTVILISANVVSFMDKLDSQSEIVAFVDDDYSEDSSSRRELCSKIESISGVNSVDYITKEQALAEHREELGKNGDYLEGYYGENNPLRNELRIKISDIEQYSVILHKISNMEEIANVRDAQEVVDLLLSVRKTLRFLGIWIMLILAVVSLFIISNTLKLTMYNRKNEINIMKYVGATNAFIRFPFILEGIMIGIVSTLFAIGLQWCLYSYAISPLLSDIAFLSDTVVNFKMVLPDLAVVFGAIGLLVGLFGSAFSIHKYLKV